MQIRRKHKVAMKQLNMLSETESTLQNFDKVEIGNKTIHFVEQQDEVDSQMMAPSTQMTRAGITPVMKHPTFARMAELSGSDSDESIVEVNGESQSDANAKSHTNVNGKKSSKMRVVNGAAR